MVRLADSCPRPRGRLVPLLLTIPQLVYFREPRRWAEILRKGWYSKQAWVGLICREEDAGRMRWLRDTCQWTLTDEGRLRAAFYFPNEAPMKSDRHDTDKVSLDEIRRQLAERETMIPCPACETSPNCGVCLGVGAIPVSSPLP